MKAIKLIEIQDKYANGELSRMEASLELIHAGCKAHEAIDVLGMVTPISYSQIEVHNLCSAAFAEGMKHNIENLPTPRVNFSEWWSTNKKKPDETR